MHPFTVLGVYTAEETHSIKSFRWGMAASESQIATNKRLILIQKTSQRNKILIGRSRDKSRTFANPAAKPMGEKPVVVMSSKCGQLICVLNSQCIGIGLVLTGLPIF